MKKENPDYSKLIKSSLREVNRNNINSYEFSQKEKFEILEIEFLQNLPFNLFDLFYKYIDLIIDYVLEIRKEDCINIFTNGFKKGIEFERYLNDKYEKSEQ